jgi:hypothetical protein
VEARFNIAQASPNPTGFLAAARKIRPFSSAQEFCCHQRFFVAMYFLSMLGEVLKFYTLKM